MNKIPQTIIFQHDDESREFLEQLEIPYTILDPEDPEVQKEYKRLIDNHHYSKYSLAPNIIEKTVLIGGKEPVYSYKTFSIEEYKILWGEPSVTDSYDEDTDEDELAYR